MKKIFVNNPFWCVLLVISFSLILDSCKKALTIEERKNNLENKISDNDCKEITNDALQAVIKDLKDVKFENITHGVEEDIHSINAEDNLYISVVVRGDAKGILNGEDSIYSFYLYGRIPESLADKKQFDSDGYNLSLKKNDVYVYSNKDDVDALNKEKIESQKIAEELRKKDFIVGGTKVRFDRQDGNTLFYNSPRELTPDEIADAVQNKIESDGVNMIRFYSGSEEFADYVFSTKCIIYVKYPDKIYKIIGGSPEKV